MPPQPICVVEWRAVFEEHEPNTAALERLAQRVETIIFSREYVSACDFAERFGGDWSRVGALLGAPALCDVLSAATPPQHLLRCSLMGFLLHFIPKQGVFALMQVRTQRHSITHMLASKPNKLFVNNRSPGCAQAGVHGALADIASRCDKSTLPEVSVHKSLWGMLATWAADAAAAHPRVSYGHRPALVRFFLESINLGVGGIKAMLDGDPSFRSFPDSVRAVAPELLVKICDSFIAVENLAEAHSDVTPVLVEHKAAELACRTLHVVTAVPHLASDHDDRGEQVFTCLRLLRLALPSPDALQRFLLQPPTPNASAQLGMTAIVKALASCHAAGLAAGARPTLRFLKGLAMNLSIVVQAVGIAIVHLAPSDTSAGGAAAAAKAAAALGAPLRVLGAVADTGFAAAARNIARGRYMSEALKGATHVGLLAGLAAPASEREEDWAFLQASLPGLCKVRFVCCAGCNGIRKVLGGVLYALHGACNGRQSSPGVCGAVW